tara:strand:- start:1029 stop:1139 length:111 start_codon:yes stop_codon:yes gene_type:complete
MYVGNIAIGLKNRKKREKKRRGEQLDSSFPLRTLFL